jgi:hypothetical protein
MKTLICIFYFLPGNLFLAATDPGWRPLKNEFRWGDPSEIRQGRNVIKWNLSPLVFSTLSFGAERAIHRKVSLGIQFSKMQPHNFIIRFHDANRSDPVFDGYSIEPQIRIFPGKKKYRPAPHGFYLGGYFRHSKHSISWTRYYPDFTINNKLSYSANTFGFFIGYQWLIGKHFSIDWQMVGIGYGLARITGGFSSPDANLSTLEQEVLQTEYSKSFSSFLGRSFGFKGIGIQTTSNSLSVSVGNISIYSFKFMQLGLGFVF